jgi:hypothetical protein
MDDDDQVNQLIEKSLRTARSVIEAGGTWGFLAHIVHPGGVQSLIAEGMHSDPSERARVNTKINLLMEVLKSNLLITISDAWISEETSDGSVAISFDSPFSGRRKALVVVVWGCSRKLISGTQEYTRLPDEQVLFGELLWGDPSSSSGF